MSFSTQREIFTFYVINSRVNVLRSSWSAPQKAIYWELSDMFYSPAFPWCDFFAFYLELQSPACWILCILVQRPKVRSRMLSSCPVAASSLLKGKMHKPSLLTFNHVIDYSCFHDTLCSPVDPLIFTWHQEKCDAFIFFVI